MIILMVVAIFPSLLLNNDAYLFLSGSGFSYILVTLYQLIDSAIVRSDFTNYYNPDCCEESDKLFILYKRQPAILFVDYDNKASLKFYKKKYRINPDRIDYALIFKEEIVLRFKNGEIKSFKIIDFTDDRVK